MAYSAISATPHHHEEWSGWRKYFHFNTDHKVIGVQYIVLSSIFLVAGLVMAMLIRAQLLTPNLLVLDAQSYNAVVTVHGTTMIFLWLIPVFTGMINFILPLQLGAPDMAFPRLNALSVWTFPIGGIVILAGLAVGPEQAGWTSYVPLAIQGPLGQTFWLVGLTIIGASSIMGAINFITTIVTMRAPGMTMWRMPLFVWATFSTSILILFGVPVLTDGLILQLFDRVLDTPFFAPARGGDVLLWQHLFWFYSHPAVYIMILPGMGMISEVVSAFSRKQLYGYKLMGISVFAISVISFSVWAHHMFATGAAPAVLIPMMIMSMVIAVPTGIKVFSWLGTLWGGRLWLRTPLLFALAFISQFLVAGVTGVMQASIPLDLQVEDSYFIVGHLHYALFGGGVFAAFVGIYYWYPKITGRMYNERLGKLHFALAFPSFYGLYLPMFWLGLMGLPRRVAGYPAEFTGINQFMSVCGFILGFSFLIYFANMIGSWIWGPKAEQNPWRAYTLEWAAATPVPPHNFPETPTVTLDPYPFGRGITPPGVAAPANPSQPKFE